MRAAVTAVVEATRAAGIHAILEEISSVLISGVFYLIPDVTVQAGAVQTFLQAVSDALDQSPIGAPLSVRRLIALVYGVPGLVDVAEAQLSTPQGPFNDSLLIAPTQQIRPDETNLKAELLKGLVAPGPTRTSGANRLVDLQLVQVDGTPVSFRNFKLDVQVALRAHSRTIPSQPPELVGVFAHTVTFANGATGTLTITPDDTSGYRPADHAPDVDVSLSAAAYPGLSGAGTTIRLS